MGDIHSRDDRNVLAWSFDHDIICAAQKEQRKSTIANSEQTLEQLLLDLGRKRQEHLYKSRVLIVGGGLLAQMALSCFAGMGAGNIMIMDDESSKAYEPTFLTKRTGSLGSIHYRAGGLEVAAKEIHPHACVIGYHMPFNAAFARHFSPHVVVEASNSLESKERALAFCMGKCKGHALQTPLISASTTDNAGSYALFSPRFLATGTRNIPLKPSDDLSCLSHPEYTGLAQGVVTSGVISGLAAEEFRRILFRYSSRGIDTPVASGKQFMYSQDSFWQGATTKAMPPDKECYAGKKILVAGAGALGNIVALELALLGAQNIDIIDMDIVEPTNISRQILLRNSLYEKKAQVVAKELRAINPSLKVHYDYAKLGNKSILPKSVQEKYSAWFELSDAQRSQGVALLEPEVLAERNYDLLFGCLDNKYARIWMNAFAVHQKIPYIDGATGAHGGQTTVYVPGHTSCIDCQRNLDGFPERNPCQVDPSTILPNMVIGSLMVAEGMRLFQKPGAQKIPLQFLYDPFSRERIMIQPHQAVLTHHGCVAGG